MQVPQVLTVSTIGQLYMSNVTIQGDGQEGRKDATQALYVDDVTSKVFAEGAQPNPSAVFSTCKCYFADGDHILMHADVLIDNVGGKQTSAMDIYGAASFLNSTFRDIKINNGKEYALFFVWERGQLMLRGANLTGNAARFDVGKNKNGLVRPTPLLILSLIHI